MDAWFPGIVRAAENQVISGNCLGFCFAVSLGLKKGYCIRHPLFPDSDSALPLFVIIM